MSSRIRMYGRDDKGPPMAPVHSNRAAETVRTIALAIFCPGAATSVGIGLHIVTGVGLAPAIVAVVAVAVMSSLVGIARAFAPHLAAVLHASSIAAIRRAARKGNIDVAKAVELIRADVSCGDNASHPEHELPS